MQNNDKGFTLVELLICMVIFAVVVSATFGFMIAGLRSYNLVTERLNLQLESQLVMNQLGEYIIDCNAGICFLNNTLYVIEEKKNMDGTITYTANVFQYKPDGCIYYGNGTATKNSLASEFTCTVTATDLLVEDITSFSVTPVSANGATDSSAIVSISIKKNNSSFSGKKIFALRNNPAIVTIQTS